MKRSRLGRLIEKATKCLLVIAGYLVFVLSNAWANPVIYLQPLNGTPSLLASENDTSNGNANYATVYDDFTLNTNATVTDVHWVGGTYVIGVPDGDPLGTGVTGFTITFYADNSGQPGVQFFSESFNDNANETPDGTLFDYSEDLAVGLVLNAGTTYWMSIVASFPGPGPAETGSVWAWAEGSGGDNLSYQDVPFPPPTGVIRLSSPEDLAFQLTGVAVPEPSTLLLLGAGLAGVGLFRRRSKK